MAFLFQKFRSSLPKGQNMVSTERFPMLSRDLRGFASTKAPYDPLARRPNPRCDPYGQGGMPLSREDTQGLLTTVDMEWRLDFNDNNLQYANALVRDFSHANFIEGAQFLSTIAAVAQIHNHYPSLHLERRLLSRSWHVATQVKCRTQTLEGLSYNDFHLAMLIDVEVARPEVQRLLITKESRNDET